jgi:ribonuclease HII
MSTHIYPTLKREKTLWKKGVTLIAGIDEAGRGAWAGPVAAAAVILPDDPLVIRSLTGVRDSKLMTSLQRSLWALQIKQIARCWGIGFASNREIDSLGILPATRLAMLRAVNRLPMFPQHLLIDAVILKEINISQTSLIKGDSLVLSIAAASVLAKTSRDAIMCDLDRQYPFYGFSSHKGYGTLLHCHALNDHGPCPMHRVTFKPIRAWMNSHA